MCGQRGRHNGGVSFRRDLFPAKTPDHPRCQQIKCSSMRHSLRYHSLFRMRVKVSRVEYVDVLGCTFLFVVDLYDRSQRNPLQIDTHLSRSWRCLVAGWNKGPQHPRTNKQACVTCIIKSGKGVWVRPSVTIIMKREP